MANLNPEDTPFLLSEESGPIDRQLLREKFTGRTSLFFNDSNYGGSRALRKNDGWNLPNLLLDPAVKYRAFHDQRWADELLSTGNSSGNWPTLSHAPKGVFYNPGLPLWSYAKGGQGYIHATLGENWGDRNANTPTTLNPSPLDWVEGNTALTERDKVAFRTSNNMPSYKFPGHDDVIPGSHSKLQAIADFGKEKEAIIKLYDSPHKIIEETLQASRGEDALEKLKETWQDLGELKHPSLKKIYQSALDEYNGFDYEDELGQLQDELKQLEGKTGYDASLDRNDINRKISKVLRNRYISALKLYKDELNDASYEDVKKLFKPEVIEALKTHGKWLGHSLDLMDKAAAGADPQLKAILELASARYGTNPSMAKFATTAEGLDLIDRLAAIREMVNTYDAVPDKFVHTPNETFSMKWEKVMPEKEWFGLSFDERMARLADWTTDSELSSISRQKVIELVANIAKDVHYTYPRSPSLGSFGFGWNLDVQPVPGSLIMKGKDPFALIDSRDTTFSNYHLDEKGNPYLLSSTGEKIPVNPSDDSFFVDQDSVLRNMTLFGGQGVVSDRRRLTLGQLEWPMLGKEGAMYSEQLPTTTYQTNWSEGPITRTEYTLTPTDEFGTPAIDDIRIGMDKRYPTGTKAHDMWWSAVKGYLGKEDKNSHLHKYESVKIDDWDYRAVRLPDGRLILIEDYDRRKLKNSHPTVSKAQLEAIKNKQNPNFFVVNEKKTTETRPSPSFTFHAASVNSNHPVRPSVLFQIDSTAPNGIRVVKEWNNEKTKWGFKPIPTEPSDPEIYRQAYIRFAKEVIEPIRSVTQESLAQKFKSDYPGLTDEDIKEMVETEWGIHQTKLLNKHIAGYTTPEDFAEKALKNGFPSSELWTLLYPVGSRTETWQSRSLTPGYTSVQNVIDESTRSNPNFGKLGSNFGPQLEAIYDTGVKLDQGINRYTRDFTRSYVNNPNFRSSINREALGAAGRYGPAGVMAAFAGMGIRDKVDSGVPLWKAVPAQGVEMGAGYYAFKYFDRYFGGVTMLGDATIDGYYRRKAEEDAIRSERLSQIVPSVVSHMTSPIEKQKVDWNEVSKQEKALESQKRKDAHDAWLKENNIFAGDVI